MCVYWGSNPAVHYGQFWQEHQNVRIYTALAQYLLKTYALLHTDYQRLVHYAKEYFIHINLHNTFIYKAAGILFYLLLTCRPLSALAVHCTNKICATAGVNVLCGHTQNQFANEPNGLQQIRDHG